MQSYDLMAHNLRKKLCAQYSGKKDTRTYCYNAALNSAQNSCSFVNASWSCKNDDQKLHTFLLFQPQVKN